MQLDDIEALKSAVQDAIAIGAPPAAMQPINDFINRVAAGPLVPEPAPQPPAITMPQDEIDALKAATDEAIAAGATPESMQPISDLLDRTEPAPDTVTDGAGNDTAGDTANGGTVRVGAGMQNF